MSRCTSRKLADYAEVIVIRPDADLIFPVGRYALVNKGLFMTSPSIGRSRIRRIFSVFSNRFAHTGQGAGPCLLVFEPHSPRDLDSLCLRRAGTVQAFSQVADRVAADR